MGTSTNNMYMSDVTNAILDLLVISFLSFCNAATSKCQGSSGLVCCVGYAWNKDKDQCEKCPVGYFNENCSEKCPYPSYGEDCQGECRCSQPMCNFITGCSHSGSVEFEWQKTKSTHFDEKSSNFSDKADLNDGSGSSTPINSKHMAHGIFGLIGVFIVLFAAFVFAYIYKQCIRYNLNRAKPEVNITQQRQYQGLATQPEVPITDDEIEATFPPLPAISFQHYEDVVSLEISPEDTKDVDEGNAHLSPLKGDDNNYANVIDYANQD